MYSHTSENEFRVNRISGIADAAFNNLLTPNPVKVGELIRFIGIEPDEMTLQLYDIKGRPVSSVVGNNQTGWQINERPGLYILVPEFNKEVRYKLLIVN
jgi:hypothetical protein